MTKELAARLHEAVCLFEKAGAVEGLDINTGRLSGGIDVLPGTDYGVLMSAPTDGMHVAVGRDGWEVDLYFYKDRIFGREVYTPLDGFASARDLSEEEVVFVFDALLEALRAI